MSAAPPVSAVAVPTDVWTLCQVSATKYGLTPSLLAALVWKESSFYPYAYNPEPRYHYLVNVRTGTPFRTVTAVEMASAFPPKDFPALFPGDDPDGEWWAQKASTGLCQVMGAVARELGFRGRSLLELVRPDMNIELGAHHLSKQIARFGSTEEGLSAYNWGHPTPENQASYVEPIMHVAGGML